MFCYIWACFLARQHHHHAMAGRTPGSVWPLAVYHPINQCIRGPTRVFLGSLICLGLVVCYAEHAHSSVLHHPCGTLSTRRTGQVIYLVPWIHSTCTVPLRCHVSHFMDATSHCLHTSPCTPSTCTNPWQHTIITIAACPHHKTPPRRQHKTPTSTAPKP
jgi:hypothetical protein